MLSILIMILNLISYQPDSINQDMLINRNGALIVEMDVGIVLDEDSNGQILNTSDDIYNYISYKGLPTRPGDLVTTYCIFNPQTNYDDDVIYRIDIVDGNVYLN